MWYYFLEIHGTYLVESFIQGVLFLSMSEIISETMHVLGTWWKPSIWPWSWWSSLLYVNFNLRRDAVFQLRKWKVREIWRSGMYFWPGGYVTSRVVKHCIQAIFSEAIHFTEKKSVATLGRSHNLSKGSHWQMV